MRVVIGLACLALPGCRMVVDRGVTYTYERRGDAAAADRAWARCKYEISKVEALSEDGFDDVRLTRECMDAAGFPVTRVRDFERVVCPAGAPGRSPDGTCKEYVD